MPTEEKQKTTNHGGDPDDADTDGGMVWGREVEYLGTGGVEYNRRLHGPLKFPTVNFTAEDRARAEAHQERHGGAGMEVEARGDPKDREEEMYPAVGPFQCEICRQNSITKKSFVNHIKANHLDL